MKKLAFVRCRTPCRCSGVRAAAPFLIIVVQVGRRKVVVVYHCRCHSSDSESTHCRLASQLPVLVTIS